MTVGLSECVTEAGGERWRRGADKERKTNDCGRKDKGGVAVYSVVVLLSAQANTERERSRVRVSHKKIAHSTIPRGSSEQFVTTDCDFLFLVSLANITSFLLFIHSFEPKTNEENENTVNRRPCKHTTPGDLCGALCCFQAAAICN